jgi:hypothetical protein
LNTLRGKYKILSSDLTNQERQEAEAVINKIEVYIIVLLLLLLSNEFNFIARINTITTAD